MAASTSLRVVLLQTQAELRGIFVAGFEHFTLPLHQVNISGGAGNTTNGFVVIAPWVTQKLNYDWN
jgi:hypothetical protein